VRRLTRRAATLAALVGTAALGACAEMQRPRGGPEDPLPPRVVGISPDTGTTGVRPRAVVFRFDEVVSERPGASSAHSLADLVLVSPESGETRVDWDREELRVRPHRGWRENTTYTVTLLPGIADLRRNVAREGARVVFSTGSSIAGASVAGRLFDWVADRPMAGRIEAWSAGDTADADTTRWVAAADSTGRFELTYMPAGRYIVRGYVDQTPNRRLDRSEAWDTVSVVLGDSARVELLAFVHDSAGPGISSVEVRDSVSLRVGLDRPLLPEPRYPPGMFTLRAADSTSIPVAAVLTVRAADSLRAAAQSGDTTAPRVRPPRPALRDSTARPSRPAPPNEVVVFLGRPLTPGTEYRLHAELRGLLRATRGSDFRFTSAAAPTPAAGDTSARVRPAGAAPPRPQPRPPARP
jgi:hypothetical protein